MTYSMCRFWAYDESKKILGADKNSPALTLALAGTMGAQTPLDPSLTASDPWNPM